MTKSCVHIIPSLETGGAQRLVVDVCNELSARGWRVVLITFRDNNDFKEDEFKFTHRVIPSSATSSILKPDRLQVDKLSEYLLDDRPEIIHSHLFESEWIVRQINLPGPKYFSHLHNNYPQFSKLSPLTFFRKKRITDFYERRRLINAYKKTGVSFFTISRHGYRYAMRNLGRFGSNIHLLPNAIRTSEFSGRSEGTGLDLITMGNLFENKGHSLALDTVHELNGRGIDVRLKILGDGPMREVLEDHTRMLGIEDSVEFMGKVSKPRNLLSRAGIYLHTSIHETFGLAILEAMASGLPVVCTDGKGNRDLINEGQNGFLVSTRDPVVLADRIQDLQNDEKRAGMGEESVKIAAGYDIEQYVDQLLIYYSK